VAGQGVAPAADVADRGLIEQGCDLEADVVPRTTPSLQIGGSRGRPRADECRLSMVRLPQIDGSRGQSPD
jgi:hypothetical protein